MGKKQTSFFFRIQGILISLLGLLTLILSGVFRYLLVAIERGLTTCWFCG